MTDSQELFGDDIPFEEGEYAEQPQQQEPQQQPPELQPQQGEQHKQQPPSTFNSVARRQQQHKRRAPQPRHQQRPSKVQVLQPPQPASQGHRAPRSDGAGKALQPLRDDAQLQQARKDARENYESFNRALEECKKNHLWGLAQEARANRAEGLLQKVEKEKRGHGQHELELLRVKEQEHGQHLLQATEQAASAYQRGINEGLRLAQQSQQQAAQLAGLYAGKHKPCRRGGGKRHSNAEGSSCN